MIRIPKCPLCGRAPRYAVSSKKRFAKDADGNVIIENGEPVTEMAFSCRGCSNVFYSAQTGSSDTMPEASKALVKAVLELKKKRDEAKLKEEGK